MRLGGIARELRPGVVGAAWEFRQRLVWIRVLAVLHPSGIGSLGQYAITLGNQKELNLTIRILDPAGGGAGVFR